MASERDALAALVKDAYYHARDNGGTMHTAADDAADAVLAAGWVSPGWVEQEVSRPWRELYRDTSAKRDALAAVVDRVRALCALPDPDNPAAMQPYAVDLSDGVHLAVLVDDLRAALNGEEACDGE